MVPQPFISPQTKNTTTTMEVESCGAGMGRDNLLFLRYFPMWSAHRVSNLHVLRYCASSIFTCFSFMYFLITSLHLSFGFPIFRCPTTSVFHVLIATCTSFPVFLSTWTISVSLLRLYVWHTCSCSYFFIPDLRNPISFRHPSQHFHFFLARPCQRAWKNNVF